MSKATVRSGFDTWVDSERPNSGHPRGTSLWVRSGVRNAFVWHRTPAPLGASITSATLTLWVRGASSATRGVLAMRVAESWKEGNTRWTSRPGVTGPEVVETVGPLDDADPVNIDVTQIVQAWANGAPNYGIRIGSTLDVLHRFYSMDSAHPPRLAVEWSDAPATPSDLQPSEAATSLAKPYVTFTYRDVSGNTELAAVQVQISATQSFTTPVFDSGEVATQASGLDLATTAYAGLADGQTVFWRVRAKDGAGLWSNWSQPVSMTREVKPTVAITNLVGGVVYEPTPPILWSVTGGTQLRYRIFVDDVLRPGRAVHDSGQIESAEMAYTIPSGVLKDGRNYRVILRVWDSEDREATPGDPTYVQVSEVFHADTDAAIAPVDTLVADQVGQTPTVRLTWTRSTTPDRFVLVRDGEVLRTLESAEVFVSGTTYQYDYYGPMPNVEHTYEVRAVVNGRQSRANATVSYAVPVEGIWLTDPGRAVWVVLWGDDPGTWDSEDDASVYTPVGSTKAVRIVSGMRGHEGSLSGLLMEGFGQTFESLEKDLYAIKGTPTDSVRLIAGDINIPVIVGNVSVSPNPLTRKGRLVKSVSFDFWQNGEIPFDASV